MSGSALRHVAIAIILAIALTFTPRSASAQGLMYEQIAIAAAQIYNGNVFAATASAAESDLILRVGPQISAGYRSAPLTIAGKYLLQAERYVNHSDLNRLVAYQAGGVTMDWHATRRLVLTETAEFVSTQTPSELNTLTFITTGRAPAHRFLAGSGVAYNLSEVSTIKARVEYAREAFSAARTNTAGAQATYGRKVGRRNEYRVGYGARWVDWTGFGTTSTEASQAVTFGWSSAITRAWRIDADAGPRFGDGIRPELSFGLHHTMRRSEQAVTYAETRTTAIGQPGALDVRRAVIDGSWQATRRLSFGGALDLARSTGTVVNGTEISVVALQLRASVQATRRIALVFSGETGQQLNRSAAVRTSIPLRIVSAALTFSLPEQTTRGKGR